MTGRMPRASSVWWPASDRPAPSVIGSDESSPPWLWRPWSWWSTRSRNQPPCVTFTGRATCLDPSVSSWTTTRALPSACSPDDRSSLTVVVALLTLAVLWAIWRGRSMGVCLCLGLVLGGALGNLCGPSGPSPWRAGG